MKRFLRDNGLTLVFGLIFLLALVGQSAAGHANFNQDQLSHGADPISWGRYVTSSSFASDVLENWQSEYLQFALYIFATVWFLQRGSSESKPLGQAGRESDEEQEIGEHAHERSPRWAQVGGRKLRLYSNSLLLVMLLLFFGSWLGQSVAGRVGYNADQLDHRQDPVTWPQYVASSDFWNRTLQNWQSEFLAVGSMAIFAVYLRQRGSPESKPVGAAHDDTGAQG